MEEVREERFVQERDVLQPRDGATVVSPEGCFQHRYVVTAFICTGTSLLFALRVDLSVAIVAMVNQTYVKSDQLDQTGAFTTLLNNTVAMDNQSVAMDNQAATFNECANRTSMNSENIQNGDFNWDKKTQGLILSSIFYGYIILQIPGGWLASRVNGKLTVTLSVLVTAILCLYIPLAARTSPWLLVALRAVQGLSLGMVYPGNIAISARWFPKYELTWLASLIQVGAAMGVVLGMTVSGVLSQYVGWEYVFYTFGAVALLWLLLWTIFVTESPRDHKSISQEERDYIENSTSIEKHDNSTPWLKIFTSPKVWATVILFFSFDWFLYTLMLVLPQYMNDILNFNLSQNGLLSAIPYLVYCLVAMTSSKLVDYVINKRILYSTTARKVSVTIGFLGTAVFFVCIKYVGCDRDLAVVFLTFGFAFEGFVSHVVMSNPMDLSRNHAGIIFGLSNTVSSLAGMLAPFSVAMATEKAVTRENWMIIFYLSSAVGILGLIIFVIFGTAERRRWDEPNRRTPYEIELDQNL